VKLTLFNLLSACLKLRRVMWPSVSTKTGAAVVGPSKIGEGGLELL
jgi:hypothetical protein